MSKNVIFFSLNSFVDIFNFIPLYYLHKYTYLFIYLFISMCE